MRRNDPQLVFSKKQLGRQGKKAVRQHASFVVYRGSALLEAEEYPV
jgi:hypothetical protein